MSQQYGVIRRDSKVPFSSNLYKKNHACDVYYVERQPRHSASMNPSMNEHNLQVHQMHTYDLENWKVVPLEDENGGAIDNLLQRGEIRLVDWRALEKPKMMPGFSFLPAEIRNQIWEESLPEEKLVCIQFMNDENNIEFAVDEYADSHDTYQHMFTCRESWSIYLSHYSNIQRNTQAGTDPRDDANHRPTRKPIYVDVERDIVVLPQREESFLFGPSLSSLQLSCVQNLAVPWNQWFMNLNNWLHLFPLLEDLTVVLNERVPYFGPEQPRPGTHGPDIVWTPLLLQVTSKLSHYTPHMSNLQGPPVDDEPPCVKMWQESSKNVYKTLKPQFLASHRDLWEEINFECCILGTEFCEEAWYAALLGLAPREGLVAQTTEKVAYCTIKLIAQCFESQPVYFHYYNSMRQSVYYAINLQEDMANTSYKGLAELFGETSLRSPRKTRTDRGNLVLSLRLGAANRAVSFIHEWRKRKTNKSAEHTPL
ncbi:hypothetical protein HYFRA_00011110 [Hymenoscyphus fraxineus]|uniref:2EXR domain-containing protein n=1 Tax=Hymenoscyphus fraxineus TaxID=746836 RepID=A0A9N9PX28_9HELO|nr:hypothetical protein HYFRA_00011110 [Hymenoscyphus fraxineus]